MMMSYPYEGLVYSAVEGMTPGRIKSGDYPEDVAIQSLETWMSDHQVGVAIQEDKQYCHRLRTIKSAPYLYYRVGNHDLLYRPLLGIVGPRKKTDYADRVVNAVLSHAASYELATISGMADGVDMLCHRGSIQCGIPTIAVLGSGLGRMMRSSRASVVREIVDAGGLVLSEFPLGLKATHYTYPQRNRIVAGLSQCVYLPEAREGSGSLITVDFARAMSIPVYGAPQDMFADSSAGLGQAMQAGHVSPVVDIPSWLDSEFGSYKKSDHIEFVSIAASTDLTDIQRSIVDMLAEQGPQSVGSLAASVGLSTPELIGELTMMEMDGLVRSSPSGEWSV